MKTWCNWYICISSSMAFPRHNIQQKIDLPTETIELVNTSVSDAEDVSRAISDDEPRFSLYRYTHEFEGQHLSPIVFIYTCPSGAKVKERMVYASSRASVIAYASNEVGLKVEKKVRQLVVLFDRMRYIVNVATVSWRHPVRPRSRRRYCKKSFTRRE